MNCTPEIIYIRQSCEGFPLSYSDYIAIITVPFQVLAMLLLAPLTFFICFHQIRNHYIVFPKFELMYKNIYEKLEEKGGKSPNVILPK